MRPSALGEAAARLTWLSPTAASLTALARSPVCWPTIRNDPGAVLLLLRHAPAVFPAEPLIPSLLRDARVLDAAVRWLKEPAWADWDNPAVRPIYQFARACATASVEQAKQNPHVDPDLAWAVGMIAPLGWFAACAVRENGLHAFFHPLLARGQSHESGPGSASP